jgi:hypothetical protein
MTTESPGVSPGPEHMRSCPDVETVIGLGHGRRDALLSGQPPIYNGSIWGSPSRTQRRTLISAHGPGPTGRSGAAADFGRLFRVAYLLDAHCVIQAKSNAFQLLKIAVSPRSRPSLRCPQITP